MTRFAILLTMLVLSAAFAKVTLERESFDTTISAPSTTTTTWMPPDLQHVSLKPLLPTDGLDVPMTNTQVKLIQIQIPPPPQETTDKITESMPRRRWARFLPFWGSAPGSVRFAPFMRDSVEVLVDALSFGPIFRVEK
jgi:hypothetical protein